MYYIKSLVTWKCIYITSFHCVRASCTSCTRIVYTIYVHRVRAFCQEVNNHWDITLLFSQFSHLNLMTVAEEYLKYFTTKWCVIFDKFKIDNHLHFLYIYTYCTSTLTVRLHLLYFYTYCTSTLTLRLHLLYFYTYCTSTLPVCLHLLYVYTYCTSTLTVRVHLLYVYTSCTSTCIALVCL